MYFLAVCEKHTLLENTGKMPGNYNILLNNREITLYTLECCSRK